MVNIESPTTSANHNTSAILNHIFIDIISGSFLFLSFMKVFL